MNCQTFSEADFKSTVLAEQQEPLYRPTAAKGQLWMARFELKNFNEDAAPTTLLIGSDSAAGLIFSGPYQASFGLMVNRNFLERAGRDSFRFALINPKSKRICVVEEASEFWQEGRVVTIELLPVRKTDSAGLPVALQVTSRAP